MAGRIYFIRCGEFVKIGFSSRLGNRLSSIKTSTPSDVELLGSVAGDRAKEAAFHERFRASHHRGEWFRFEGDVQRTVQTLFAYERPTSERVAAALEDPYDAGARRAAHEHFAARGKRGARKLSCSV